MVLTASCLTPPRVETPIYHGKKTAVSLVTVPVESFRASHPKDLEPDTLAAVLRGLRIHHQKGSVQNWMAGAEQATRVFSEQDITVLVPHLVEALSQATPEEQVVFNVVQVDGDQPGNTGGALSAHGSTLHVTIARYRFNPDRPALVSLPTHQIPDPTGLNKRHVSFIPKAALEPTPKSNAPSFDQPAQTLAINLNTLSRALADVESETSAPPERMRKPASSPEAPKASTPRSGAAPPKKRPSNDERGERDERDKEVERLKDLVIKKDLEIEALKDALERLRRQVEEQGP